MNLGRDLDWAIDGECIKWTKLNWVPELEDEPVTAEQERICGGCSVKAECLAYALGNDVDGVWAATNSYTRRVMQVPRNRVKCPGCSSTDVIKAGSDQICMSCGISWASLVET